MANYGINPPGGRGNPVKKKPTPKSAPGFKTGRPVPMPGSPRRPKP